MAPKNTRWVLAHRTLWIQEDSVSYTADAKKRSESQIHQENISKGRIAEDYSYDRKRFSLHNIVMKENYLARRSRLAIMSGDTIELAKIRTKKSPLEKINQLFSISNIPFVISMNEQEQFHASKDRGMPYSIKELSDGEKNTLLLCADVITAPLGTLILLDEPERHLHRSIISTLLLSLVQHRPDCAFVVATHELGLPENRPQSKNVLLRNIAWKNHNTTWDVDIIAGTESIPEDIQRAVLGSRRKLLFVEGISTSMDKLLYECCIRVTQFRQNRLAF